MNTKISGNDVIWNYIGIFMTMFGNFLNLPFMLKYMDSEVLGLWYVFLSIGGIVTLFDFGFNPTFARNISYIWNGAEKIVPEGVTYAKGKEVNFNLLATLVKVSKIIYLVIAVAALVVLISCGTLYIKVVGKEVLTPIVWGAWYIYSIAVFMNIYYGCYTTFLRGVGAISIYNKINVGARIIQIVISITLLILEFNILAVALAYLLYGFILRFFSKRIFLKYCDIGKNISKVDNEISPNDLKEMFYSIWHNAWKDGIVTLANYITNQAGTLISSVFLSLTETGIYSMTVQLVTAIVTISGGLYSAYQPTLQAAYIVNDKKILKEKMSLIMCMNLYISLIGGGCLFLFGPPLIHLFNAEISLRRTVIIGVFIYMFLYRRQSTYASFISNMNYVPYVFPYIISSVSGILIAFLLMKYMQLGIWGMVLGQMIPQAIYNYWKWPNKVMRFFECDINNFIHIGNKEIMKILKGLQANESAICDR